ncbi:hypothetical protein ES703_88623 [subsurface metagenome]
MVDFFGYLENLEDVKFGLHYAGLSKKPCPVFKLRITTLLSLSTINILNLFEKNNCPLLVCNIINAWWLVGAPLLSSSHTN